MVHLFLPAMATFVAAAVACRLSHHLRPWLTTWALTTLCVAAGVASGAALAAIVVDQLAAFPWLAARVGWCTRVATSPAAVVAVVGSLVGVAGATLNLSRAARQQRALTRSFGADPVVVVPTSAVVALAVPGRLGHPGQIVVSTGMFEALDAEERSAMFAHEMAHLRLRHHLFLRVTGLAAAALPLLRPVHRRVAFSTERWADERAARDVGSRSLVARAVAKSALAAAGEPLPVGVLALNGGSTGARVVALVEGRAAAASVEAVFGLMTAVAVGLAATQLHHLVVLVLDAC